MEGPIYTFGLVFLAPGSVLSSEEMKTSFMGLVGYQPATQSSTDLILT
jgi:hypothetical protein